VEGPDAPELQKSLNANTATAQKAATEPNRSQSPLCLYKTPPQIYHPMCRLDRREMAPDYLSRWLSIGSNSIWKITAGTAAHGEKS
jgi:hypothetical protein